MIEAIYKRKSTRFFLSDPISDQMLYYIIDAARHAPSPKNRQPWKFIAVMENEKESMLAAMEKGIKRAEEGQGLLSEKKEYIYNAWQTLKIMAEAPVTVFVVNPLGRSLGAEWTISDKINEMSNVQAIGAAMENMALAAEDLGIGSLWNGNIFFAFEELTAYLGEKGILTAAMSFGYGSRCTYSPSRKSIEDILSVRR